MSDVRTPVDALGPIAPAERRGAREGRVSRRCLWWLLAEPFVGFALAGRVFDLGAGGDWETWKAAILGAVLMVPFVVGAYFGLRSILKGYLRGWVWFALNLAFAALAIGMPVWESLTG